MKLLCFKFVVETKQTHEGQDIISLVSCRLAKYFVFTDTDKAVN